MTSRKSHFAGAAAVAAGVLVLLVLMLAGAGYSIADAAGAAARGSLGSGYAALTTLKRATPLMLLGVSVAVSFRAGVLNIGGEGQFLAGAAAGIAIGLGFPGSAPSAVVIACELFGGIAAGAAWGGIAAFLRSRFGASEVVTTLLLNFVALNLIGFLVRGPMQEPTGAYPQSATIPEGARLPMLLAGQRLHLGFVLAVAVAVGASIVFRRAAAGFRLLISGVGPRAAESAGGVDVAAVRRRALIASGAIAGLAGVSEAAGVTHILYEGLSPGYGYLAIGVALLGALNPLAIIASAILFGGLGSAADAMQRDAQVPAEFASVVAAMILLALLAAPRIRILLTRPAAGDAA